MVSCLCPDAGALNWRELLSENGFCNESLTSCARRMDCKELENLEPPADCLDESRGQFLKFWRQPYYQISLQNTTSCSWNSEQATAIDATQVIFAASSLNIPTFSSEQQQIRKAVEKLLTLLSTKIGNHNKRLRFTPRFVGSSVEGTRV